MICSMTGYANRQMILTNNTINIEIKSVNHRFFDLSIKCPDEIRQIESLIREQINNKIQRGKVELKINIKNSNHTNSFLKLNQDILSQYMEISLQIQNNIPNIKQPSIVEILNLNGILLQENIEIEEIKPIILEEINKLIIDLELNQAKEGNTLANVILEKLNKIENTIECIIKILPQKINAYKDKLHQKLVEALGENEVNENRFSQEFVYFCQKIDVNEEIERLNSHIKQFKDILNKGGVIGKKIDFITQEMHREANTLGSKSVAIETTQFVIDLKILIEQIREQIQNIA
ncbi:MAG TPA: YicC family protein [Burkholderiales bacterium]|nr:YicC family protein [Burkholderiales bacterium]